MWDIIHIREFLQNIENEEAILAAAGNNNDWILEYEDIIGTKFKRYDILDSSILQMYEVDQKYESEHYVEYREYEGFLCFSLVSLKS